MDGGEGPAERRARPVAHGVRHLLDRTVTAGEQVASSDA
jgi:hypothetical protein